MTWNEVFEGLPQAFGVVDGRGEFLQENRAMRELRAAHAAIETAEFSGLCLLCGDACEVLCTILAQCLAGAGPGSIRRRYRHRMTGRILEWTFLPLAGRTAVLVQAEDVTDRHPQERIEHILRHLVEQTPEMVGIAGPDRQHVWANPAAKALFRTIGAAQAGSPEAVRVEDMQPRIAGMSAADALAAAHAGPVVYDNIPLHRPGEHEPFAYTSQVIVSWHDDVTDEHYYATICRDVTDRQQAQVRLEQANEQLQALLASRSRELNYSREFLRSLIESNRDLILSVNAAGMITFANDGFVSPQAAREMVNMPVVQMLAEEYRARFLQISTEVIDGRARHALLEAAGAGPLAGHWCLFSMGALRTADGQPGLTLIVSDLTELNTAWEQVKNTEKLAATGRMAARIAHEINNPLAGISAALQLIKADTDVTSPGYRYLAMVDREIARISNIVRQMYGLYRPEGEPSRVVDLVPVIGEVAVLMATEAADKGVDLDAQPGLPQRAKVQEQNLRQVLLNVVRNAIEVTPRGGRVSLHVERHDQCVDVIVTDQGPGLGEEVLARMFEPFYTTKDSTQGRGLGLGLSISDTLVKVMGGTISFENVPGGGCRCKVCLPEAAAD
jgi:PAS domain S-box-containing protein